MSTPSLKPFLIAVGLLTLLGFNSAGGETSVGQTQARGHSVPLALHDWDLQAPPSVSMEQVFESIWLDSESRIAFRMEPFVDSGMLTSLLESSLDEEDAEEYAEFIEESGFDPAEHMTGVLIRSESDMDDLFSDGGAAVLGLNGSFDVPAFLDYIKDYEGDEEDEEDEDSPNHITVLLEEAPDDLVELTRQICVADDRGQGDPVIIELEDAAIGYQFDEDANMSCVFVWSGGVVFTGQEEGDDDPLASMEAKLQVILDELAESSRIEIEPSDSGLALEVQSSSEGIEFECELYITNSTLLDLTMELLDEHLEEVAQLIAMLPAVQADPELLEQFVPEEYLELTEIIVMGTEASLDGDELTLEIDVPNKSVKELLESL